MAAVSVHRGRGAKGTESEQFITSGHFNSKGDTRSEGYFQHFESFKESAMKHNWWSSSKTILKLLFILFLSAVVCVGLVVHGTGALLLHANHLGRQCTNLHGRSHAPVTKYNFAMVTCSDGSKNIPHRSFEGLMDLVVPNKQSYVDRHGYDFIDASDVLDKNRPPSWSKILAVKKHLANYDYIFWNDADSVVTNPSTSLDSIIHSIAGNAHWDEMPDLILTEDVTGVNAGMFFVRNSEWSRQFLDLWWNQSSFVEPFGLCKSGDNDALKFLIATMPEAEKRQHVLIPKMQCVFNSILWRPSWKNSARLVTLTKAIWRGVYAKGDFMVHLAGLNDKKKYVQRVLEDIKEDTAGTRIITVDEVGRVLARKAGPPVRH